MNTQERLKRAADVLIDGVTADIWYAARENGEESVQQHINEVQDAMTVVYDNMPQLLKAVAALKAVRARVSGEFDCPELVEMGPLSGTLTDILRFCDTALEPLK